MKRSVNLYLQDIFDSISKVEKYTSRLSFTKFSKDEKTIDAVTRNLTIIGEATKNIPPAFKFKHPSIPWKEMAGMRNKIIHEYFGVDEEILWQTIKEDLFPLKSQVKKLLK
ncbi:MAG: DUF86 domain-containing protein [Patescibacteria group bacterium]